MSIDAKSLVVGTVYIVHHSSGNIRWKFTGMEKHLPYHSPGSFSDRRATTRYMGINLATGREITLRSTVKIRGVAVTK
jgi:hypothetical protein